ncbi:MAG: hypothetical protein FJY10_10875 [Bacteroidetes bacterium]|nr:hypothetical protein [Bacteroidota bacterium]
MVHTSRFVFILLLLVTAVAGYPADTPTNRQDNQACFNCHGKTHFRILSPDSSRMVLFRMYTDLIISEQGFYKSNHRNFKCVDCHSDEYNLYPHEGSLKFNEISTCLDCHGGDQKYAKYQFEEIETACNRSVHASRMGKDFNCYQCHDPHTYKIAARGEQEMHLVISQGNATCLACHNNSMIYNTLVEKTLPDLEKIHEWLPNQGDHFSKIRCIECHARVDQKVLVSHEILPKDKSVRDCVACHSGNSLLLQTLYKYRSTENIRTMGFMNAVILNDAYVIGANRNTGVAIIMIILLSSTLLGIILHIAFRIKRSGENKMIHKKTP